MHSVAQTQSDPDCPLPLEVLGQLHRGGEEALKEALAGLSERRRVQLALFCNSRQHLRELGLRVAALCEEHSLVQVAGSAGSVLYQQARSRPFRRTEAVVPVPAQRRVSLPRLACLSEPLAVQP